jgi:hypothetical protein
MSNYNTCTAKLLCQLLRWYYHCWCDKLGNLLEYSSNNEAVFTGAPLRLKNIYPNDFPPRFSTTTALTVLSFVTCVSLVVNVSDLRFGVGDPVLSLILGT